MFSTKEKLREYGLLRSCYYAFWQTRMALSRALRRSYSQQGEDLVMDELIGFKDTGFYVDVGASHPTRGNNTKRFSRRGWTGINIEPDPDMFRMLCADRERDVNLNVGAGSSLETVPYYRFEACNLSTFSRETADRARANGFSVKDEPMVQVRTLADILEEHRPSGSIDLMSLDTEGWELEVLRGNDWSRFRPEVICVETGSAHAGNASSRAALEEFLKDQGYVEVYYKEPNSIFALARGTAEDEPCRADEYTRHTSSRPYLKLERMTSYHYQMEMVLDALELQGCESGSILEIGGSNGVLRANLLNYFDANAMGHRITSLDIDPSSRPDVVGDVRELPFEDGSFDVAICCEVLEHMPYDDVPRALCELRRVTRGHVVITVPHTSVYLSLMLRVSRKPVKAFVLNLIEPFFLKFRRGPLAWSHHWEIGYRGYSLEGFKSLVTGCGLQVVRDFRNPVFPTHHFFFLRCT